MSDPISLSLIFEKIMVGIGAKIVFETLPPGMKNSLSKIKQWNQNIIVFDFSEIGQQKVFYEKVRDVYASAKKDIYIIGSGIRPADDKDIFLLPDEGLRKALNNGVRLYRFQTSATWIEQWGKTYTSLIRDYPDAIEVYEDPQNSQIISTALIDPDTNPILIETRQTHNYEDEHQITVLSLGLFIYNKKDLAIALKNQLLERKKSLTKIDLKEVSGVKNLTDSSHPN
jgi:hypothetical protein